ncbi:hypothetical protein [Nocardiopsis dassonvillei]|uniref:hypothetical protein n=1 Tax=Nocardiopsis dassonvillei TaxID=2014 RepID=UPI0033BFE94C
MSDPHSAAYLTLIGVLLKIISSLCGDPFPEHAIDLATGVACCAALSMRPESPSAPEE